MYTDSIFKNFGHVFRVFYGTFCCEQIFNNIFRLFILRLIIIPIFLSVNSIYPYRSWCCWCWRSIMRVMILRWSWRIIICWRMMSCLCILVKSWFSHQFFRNFFIVYIIGRSINKVSMRL